MKSHLLKIISLFIFILLITTQLNAQEKPFRIGVKVGFPNILTGNVELVTPLANERLAFMVDYSKFSFSAEGVDLDYSYFEGGINYYLRREGHGPYIGVSYTNMSLDLAYDDIESDYTTGLIGVASANIGVNTLNLKLGAKWGGLIYFRPEIGYSFTALPNTVEVEVDFQNQPMEIQVVDVPSVITGGIIVNIGFGFSF
jgi:hypothetical protein